MKGLKKYQPTPRVTVSAKAVAAALAVIVGESAALTLRELRRKSVKAPRDYYCREYWETAITPHLLAREEPKARTRPVLINHLQAFPSSQFPRYLNIKKITSNEEEPNFILTQLGSPTSRPPQPLFDFGIFNDPPATAAGRNYRRARQ